LEGIIASLGTKAGLEEVKQIKREMKKFVNVNELHNLHEKMNYMVGKDDLQELKGSLRNLRSKIDADFVKNSQQIEYVGKEVQEARVGLTQCMQKVAEKADRQITDEHMQKIRKLQAFDPNSLENRIMAKIKEYQGN
jgi:Icc-related predicted phosphoesterase